MKCFLDLEGFDPMNHMSARIHDRLADLLESFFQVNAVLRMDEASTAAHLFTAGVDEPIFMCSFDQPLIGKRDIERMLDMHGRAPGRNVLLAHEVPVPFLSDELSVDVFQAIENANGLPDWGANQLLLPAPMSCFITYPRYLAGEPYQYPVHYVKVTENWQHLRVSEAGLRVVYSMLDFL